MDNIESLKDSHVLIAAVVKSILLKKAPISEGALKNIVKWNKEHSACRTIALRVCNVYRAQSDDIVCIISLDLLVNKVNSLYHGRGPNLLGEIADFRKATRKEL